MTPTWDDALRSIDAALASLQRLGVINVLLMFCYGARDEPGRSGPHPMDN